MPFMRTAVRKGTDVATKTAIVHGVHDALVAAIGMPKEELFNIVQEYEPSDFFYDRTFNRIARSDRLVVVEITMRRGRSDAMKKAMYAGITRNSKSGPVCRHATCSSSRTRTTTPIGRSAMVFSL